MLLSLQIADRCPVTFSMEILVGVGIFPTCSSKQHRKEAGRCGAFWPWSSRKNAKSLHAPKLCSISHVGPSSVSWWYHYVSGRIKQETVVRVRWTATQPWQPLSFRHPRYTLRRSSIQVFLGLWAPNKSSVSVLETLPVKLRVHMCNLCSWVCKVNTVESWLGAEGFAVLSRSFFNYPFPSGSLHDLFLVPHPQASVVLFFFSSHFLLPSWGILWGTVV